MSSVTACGGGAHPGLQPEVPALAPHGPTAHQVSYRCVHGRTARISVSLPNPRRLAEVINAINVCEYDGGLAEIQIEIACDAATATRHVRVVAVNGKLPSSTSHAVCGS